MRKKKTQDLFLQKFYKLKSYPFTFPRKSKSASNELSYESSLAKSVKMEKLLTTWWYRVYSTAANFGHSIMYHWSMIHHQFLMRPPFTDLLVRILHFTLSPVSTAGVIYYFLSFFINTDRNSSSTPKHDDFHRWIEEWLKQQHVQETKLSRRLKN